MAGPEQEMENPFLALDKSAFPKSREPRARAPAAIQGQELSLEDKRLFEDAVSRIRPVKDKKASGFTLAQQCDLSNLKARSARKEKPMQLPTQEPEIKPDTDAEEFLSAMRNTAPLGGKGRRVMPARARSEGPSQDEPTFSEMLDEKYEFQVMFSDEYMEGRVEEADELLLNRLRQGQMSPEAHLDLHGLNAVQAFERLRDFMRDAWFKGLRVVLLVPGRGKNSPDHMGILRRKLQLWLTQDPYKRAVLAFCTAQPRDGGPGSIYVLLRRARKKGRIRWDVLPADADLF